MRHRYSGCLLAAGWITLGACRTDAAVPTAIGPDAGAQVDDASPEQAEDAVAGVTAERQLFFASGPGREAIFARERRDHARATALLDELLAQSDLTADQRGAAQLLRGLENLRRGQHADAADRFAAARQAPALAILEVRLRTLEAQARLDAGQPQAALELIAGTDPDARRQSVLDDDLLVVEADARLRTDDTEGATAHYRRYLARYPSGPRRLETKIKLARVLSHSDNPEAKKEAVELYEDLWLATPLSDYGAEAARIVPVLRKEVGARRNRKEQAAFDRRVALARLDDLVSRRQYTTARKEADALLRRRDIDDGVRCQALYHKGSAIFKQRDRAGSRPVFEQAVKVCTRADQSQEDYEVRSRYQMARGLYAEGRYERAARSLEVLASLHPKHSYADDAWVLAGECWTEHGDTKAAAKALRNALDRVEGGDMRSEARRRLLLLAFMDRAYDGVLSLTGEALAKEKLIPSERAKMLYYRGRALALTGKPAEATAAWTDAVRAEPLGYFALQALSRLRELGREGFDAGLAILTGAEHEHGPQVLEQLPANLAATKALLLARLGLGAEAREELDVAQAEGWPAVAVLNQAGLWAEGQRLIGGMRSRWRSSPPVGPSRRQWELAHPRPFARVVEENEASYSVPDTLVYAVMQTESQFDPGVTSWAGACGLTQLMPSTAAGLAKEAGVELKGDAIYDPSLNVSLGARYLGKLVSRFGGGDVGVALAVPSYNAGAGSVGKWLDQRGHLDLDLFLESIPFDETRKYAQRVLGRWFVYRWLYLGQEALPYLPMQPARVAAASG